MSLSAELRRELRSVTYERDALRARLEKLERRLPRRPIDPDTGRPGEYRSRPYRIADEALSLCREALGEPHRR